jgi:hypothetical protein
VAVSGGVCVWQESGVRRSVLCWRVLKESGLSRFEIVFIYDLLFKEILNMYFGAIFKDNVVINCIIF